jgi:hypothetical protein
MNSMMRAALLVGLALMAAPAWADDLKPMDLSAVDPGMLAEFFGPWEIQNADGDRTCDVDLSRDEAIGGMRIEVGEGCAETFPVMGEVAAWRLYENWTIVLVDATRKELLRFSAPDDAYVAEPEIDGIATIVQPD